jgi:hypothetical protein
MNENKPVLTIVFESAVLSNIVKYTTLPNGHIEFVACLQDVDIVNRNTNFYPKLVLEEALRHPRITDLIARNSWFGELGHPYQKTDFNRSIDIYNPNISHMIRESPRFESNKVFSTVRTVEPMGKIVVSWVTENGTVLGFSLRGLTPFFIEKTTPVKHKVMKAPMSVLTYDIVHFPSHSEALMQTTTEATCVSQEIEQVIDYITEESSTYKILNNELGIKISPKSDIKVMPKDSAIGITLNDGRIAKLQLEENILLEIGLAL